MQKAYLLISITACLERSLLKTLVLVMHYPDGTGTLKLFLDRLYGIPEGSVHYMVGG